MDPDDEFDPLVRTYHYLANMYCWSWRTFYYETPIGVIKELCNYLALKSGSGYMSHMEVAIAKVEARKGGAKFE